MSVSLLDHFAPLEDPRIERNKRHALLDILVLVVSAVCSNAKGWEAIEDFGHAKRSGCASSYRWRMGFPPTTALNMRMAHKLKTRALASRQAASSHYP